MIYIVYILYGVIGSSHFKLVMRKNDVTNLCNVLYEDYYTNVTTMKKDHPEWRGGVRVDFMSEERLGCDRRGLPTQRKRRRG